MMWRLFKPVDIAVLVYFRIFAGIFLAQELINSLIIGDFAEYTKPPFHFSYMAFEWLKPWSPLEMSLLYFFTIIAGFFVALGLYYRISALILFLGHTYLFLMEMAEYNNHLYLYCLISFWLIFLPANKAFSLDCLRNPEQQRSHVPQWTIWLLLFHMSIVYFFAGVAKLHEDWLSGRVLSVIWAHREQTKFLTQFENLPLIFSFGGAVFDLLIVPMLLYKPTRHIGIVASFIFHLSNALMFGLATFPWFSILMTTLFLNPSWPRKWKWFNSKIPRMSLVETLNEFSFKKKILAFGLAAYCLLHILLPLRPLLYPGNPSWTEEGHNFSWRMMLRKKMGTVRFFVVDEVTKKSRTVSPSQYLTVKQHAAMIGHPDMILQFAHFLKDEHKRIYGNEAKVFTEAKVSLNGWPGQDMINPMVDLALEKRSLWPYPWVLDQKQSYIGYSP